MLINVFCEANFAKCVPYKIAMTYSDCGCINVPKFVLAQCLLSFKSGTHRMEIEGLDPDLVVSAKDNLLRPSNSAP